MNHIKFILPVVILASILLVACRQQKSPAMPDSSRGLISDKTPQTGAGNQIMVLPQNDSVQRPEPVVVTGKAAGTTRPKLVKVRSFSDMPAERIDLYKSTAPSTYAVSGSTVIADKTNAANTITMPGVTQFPVTVPVEKGLITTKGDSK